MTELDGRNANGASRSGIAWTRRVVEAADVRLATWPKLRLARKIPRLRKKNAFGGTFPHCFGKASLHEAGHLTPPRPTPMPPKKGGKKKGGKKKGPSYFSNEDGVDHCAPFGFAAGDLIDTPLGLRACVSGVKYTSLEALEGGVLWVKYAGSDKEAPIPNPAENPGYKRASETTHLWREVDRLAKAAAVKQKARDLAKAKKAIEDAIEAAKEAKNAPQTAKKKPNAKGTKEENGDGKENAKENNVKG